MNPQNVVLRPATPADEQFVYDVKKEALGPYITEVFGWDEEAQMRFHMEEYQMENSYIILETTHSIGWLAFHQEGEVLVIDHLYLLPESQGKGVGKQLLSFVLETADRNENRVQLGVLKVNPARRLYERCGFTIIGENEHFYFMERQPSLL